MAEKLVADAEVPGIAVAVVHDDTVVYLGGFGIREEGKPETVDSDTVFRIASMSKPISSTVVAALVGEGLLDWGTKVADLEPAFALHDPYPSAQVTVRDLFNHRSGLPGSSGDDLEDIGFDREHIMRQLRLVVPSSSFRAGYAYSNAGLTMGALAAAAPTGQDWETVAEERLFEPLGMASTSYRYADFTGRANRYAGMFGPAIEAAKATYVRPPDPATAALPDAAYAGTYANTYVGEAVVAAEGGALTVRVGPDGVTSWPLTHFDRDLFLYYPDAEMPDKPAAARFTVGPDGRATALTLESLDSNGLGTLTRR